MNNNRATQSARRKAADALTHTAAGIGAVVVTVPAAGRRHYVRAALHHWLARVAITLRGVRRVDSVGIVIMWRG